MADFVFLYTGGGMPETEKDRARVLKAWDDWYKELGGAIKDGGNPFGAAKTIGRDGSVRDGAEGAPHSGFTVVTADSLDAATALAKGSPILEGGRGSVTVYQTIEM